MTPTQKKITISIVEDDAEMRALYSEWLVQADDFELISEHSNGLEALEALPKENPEVVLMDINLPGMDGVECVRQLKASHPGIQFVMMTVFDDSNRIFSALTAGATGYLLKQTPREELLTSLLDVYRGGSPMSGSIARKVVRCFRSTPSTNTEDEIGQLSSREEEVLEMLTQGFLCKEIADKLKISRHTVDTYLRRIYEKLHVNSRSQAAAVYAEMKSHKHPLSPPKA